MVWLEYDDGASLIIETDAAYYENQEATLLIKPFLDLDYDISVEPFALSVLFFAEEDEETLIELEDDENYDIEEELTLEFDLLDFEVSPITCSENDQDWKMELPPLLNEDLFEVESISWDYKNSDLFSFNEDEQTV